MEVRGRDCIAIEAVTGKAELRSLPGQSRVQAGYLYGGVDRFPALSAVCGMFEDVGGNGRACR